MGFNPVTAEQHPRTFFSPQQLPKVPHPVTMETTIPWAPPKKKRVISVCTHTVLSFGDVWNTVSNQKKKHFLLFLGMICRSSRCTESFQDLHDRLQHQDNITNDFLQQRLRLDNILGYFSDLFQQLFTWVQKNTWRPILQKWSGRWNMETCLHPSPFFQFSSYLKIQAVFQYDFFTT